MKRVLFILSNLIIGGVEKVCWEIVSHIDNSKYHIDFLVAIDSNVYQYYEPLLIKKGCQIYKGGYIRNSADKKKFLKKENELILQNRYDIVHSHMDFMNIWTLKVAKKQGVEIRISHVHTSFPDKDEWDIRAKAKYFLQCRLMPVYSNVRLGCSALANESFYPKTSSEVLKNGFDIEPFLNCGYSQKKRNKNIIAIGRIDHQKNPMFICRVMHELVKLDSEFVLYWIGDGRFRQKVEAAIDDYSLGNNIHLVGATTNIFPYLGMCSIAICPSFFEGLGISIVETQLAKCFTFYSDVVPEEANIGYGMALPLSEGAKAWAEKIFVYTTQNQSCHFKLDVEKANEYDIHKVIQRLEAIYDRS